MSDSLPRCFSVNICMPVLHMIALYEVAGSNLTTRDHACTRDRCTYVGCRQLTKVADMKAIVMGVK